MVRRSQSSCCQLPQPLERGRLLRIHPAHPGQEAPIEGEVAQRLAQAFRGGLRVGREQRQRQVGPDKDGVQSVSVLMEQRRVEPAPGERVREQACLVCRADGERHAAGGHVVDGDGDRQAVHVEAHARGQCPDPLHRLVGRVGIGGHLLLLLVEPVVQIPRLHFVDLEIPGDPREQRLVGRPGRLLERGEIAKHLGRREAGERELRRRAAGEALLATDPIRHRHGLADQRRSRGAERGNRLEGAAAGRAIGSGLDDDGELGLGQRLAVELETELTEGVLDGGLELPQAHCQRRVGLGGQEVVGLRPEAAGPASSPAPGPSTGR